MKFGYKMGLVLFSTWFIWLWYCFKRAVEMEVLVVFDAFILGIIAWLFYFIPLYFYYHSDVPDKKRMRNHIIIDVSVIFGSLALLTYLLE